MKQKTTNWILLTGALLLGAFILLNERGGETPQQQMQRSRTIFAIYPDSLEQIVLERDGVLIECTRTPGGWQLTRPVSAPLDSGRVDQMIAGMARVERGELITGDTLRERNLTPSDYGFDTPRARITFKNSRGTSIWLIGRDAPVGKTLYVMSEAGADIISAPQTLLHLIPQDPAWIRDRTLFAGEPSAVRGLDLRRPGGFLQLRQPEGNSWKMQQPHAGRGDRQSIHALIGKIYSGRAAGFISDEKTDLTVYGLEKPDYELTVFTQDERTQTLLIGKHPTDTPELRYAKKIENDSVFTVPSEWTKEFDVETGLLRSRNVIGLLPERMTAIQLIRGDRQIELTRTNGLWQVVRPVRWDADPARTAELLKALSTAAVEEFIDAPSAAQTARMDAAPWKAVLEAGTRTNILHISGPGETGLRMVRLNEESSFYLTGGGMIREDFADPLFYRSRTMLEINPGAILTLTARKADGTERSVRKTESGTFVAGRSDRQVQADALTDLMWTLNDLRAVRLTDYNPGSLAPYGLEQPETVLTVTVSETDTIGRMVLIGNATDDGRFSMIQGQNIVFVVSEETARTITRELTVPGEKKSEELQQP